MRDPISGDPTDAIVPSRGIRGIFPRQDGPIFGLPLLVGARRGAAPRPTAQGGLRLQPAHLARQHAGELGQDHAVTTKREAEGRCDVRAINSDG